jgi:hypothetical protein
LKIKPGLILNREIQITTVNPPPAMVNGHIVVLESPPQAK